MGLREAKRSELRAAIVATAIRLFRENGYDETRVQEIVRRVRISEATFFNHFSSKQALLDQFTLDTVESYTALLRYELLEDDRPIPDRIRELVLVIGQAFTADRAFMAVVARRSNLFYGATDLTRERHLKAYELLAELFRQGQQRGEIRRDVDAIQLAEILTATYTLTIANWLIAWWDDAGELEPRLSKTMDVFLGGTAPPHGGPPATAKRTKTSRRAPPRERGRKR